MIDRRIRIPKDKDDFVKQLVSGDGGSGPFQLKVDVLAFAALLGAARNHKRHFDEATKEPIRQEVFDRQGYDSIINLLAVYDSGSTALLSDEDDKVEQRAVVFEAYANGGLEILKEKLKGSIDPTNEILLLIRERMQQGKQVEAIDITSLLQ